ncbi:MAG TPA: adenine deaminase [Firmicutes bacterium]|nr:adenine deaminase [Bacillota bacterium]
MLHSGARRPLYDVGRELVATAMGREPADVVIRGGKLVNVHTAEIQDGVDVAVRSGRVALVGDASRCIGPGTRVMDAGGYYLVPGFLDGHVHVESSMMTVREFAKAVLPCGTTAIFMDPHEIANVLGVEGVRLMLEEARGLPLKVFATMPSCVPAAPGFEDGGAVIGPDAIREAMAWDEVAGLGEMMNYPGVLAGDEKVHEEIRQTLKAGKVVTGHYSIPDTGPDLAAYVAAGIISDHESTRAEDALAKLRLGMYAKLREGSAWRDIKATIKSYTETGIDPRHIVLVTDDAHPDTLVTLGHVNHVVRRAIEEGVPPVRAIQMATINTAECFRMSQDLGSIAPGKVADILFIGDLADPRPDRVMADGEIVAEGGRTAVDMPSFAYPDFATRSVRLAKRLEPGDFRITIDPGFWAGVRPGQAPSRSVRARVIEVIEASALTRHVEIDIPVDENREVRACPEKDVAKVAVVERHRASGTMAVGLVRGFGLSDGAAASTVAHDSHNLLVVGMNDQDMAVAGNILAEAGGGMVVVKGGEPLAFLPLPIAGLMSAEPVERVRAGVEELARAWRALGCTMTSPFMTMALLALPVIPELRITNRGLVDTREFKFVGLLV